MQWHCTKILKKKFEAPNYFLKPMKISKKASKKIKTKASNKHQISMEQAQKHKLTQNNRKTPKT